MKKYGRWMLDITLLVMVGLGFIWPDSVAFTVVHGWALLGIGVCVVALAFGLVSQVLWGNGGKPGVSEIATRVLGLGQTLTLKKQLRFIVMLSLITDCLLSAGFISTALWYLAASLAFRFTRALFLMVFGSQSCPEPAA